MVCCKVFGGLITSSQTRRQASEAELCRDLLLLYDAAYSLHYSVMNLNQSNYLFEDRRVRYAWHTTCM